MLTDGGTPVSWSHCNMRVVPSTWHGSVRRSRGRPTRPSCELGARCGWPAEGKDPTTLRFSASVRQIVLEQWLGAIPDFCTWPYLRYFFCTHFDELAIKKRIVDGCQFVEVRTKKIIFQHKWFGDAGYILERSRLITGVKFAVFFQCSCIVSSIGGAKGSACSTKRSLSPFLIICG